MKHILIIFLIFSNVFYSQNKFNDISCNRIKISKFVFGEILDNNTFNSSLVTKDIFHNSNLKVYTIKTYSPHAILNVCIIYKKKVNLFEIKRCEDIDEISLFLLRKNISSDISKNIESKIKAISLYMKSEDIETKLIYKIDSINDFYLIYVKFQNKNYKVVSKKESMSASEKIKVGNKYKTFNLKGIINPSDYIPKYTETASPLSFVPDCLKFDEKTEICRERGMDNIYTSNNVVGLHYIKFSYEK